MTDQQSYDKAAELATDTLKLIRDNPYEKIVNGMWAPLQLLYVEMAKRKEIPAMVELSLERKTYYWNQVKGFDVSQYRKIWIMQSLYLYDLITEISIHQ